MTVFFSGKYQRTVLNSADFMMCGWQILCTHFPASFSEAITAGSTEKKVGSNVLIQPSVLRWAIRSHPTQAEIVDVKKGNESWVSHCIGQIIACLCAKR